MTTIQNTFSLAFSYNLTLLKAGDQVLRINQRSVEGSVHKEVAAMVQASNCILMQVKGTGIIPIKE